MSELIPDPQAPNLRHIAMLAKLWLCLTKQTFSLIRLDAKTVALTTNFFTRISHIIVSKQEELQKPVIVEIALL